jgi:hypothetical protein
MQIILVLAVGLDWYLLENQRAAWKSAGVFAISTASIKGAIDHFQAGDFDLVLMGPSIPAEARERLTFLIRSSGAHVPVVSIAGSPGHRDSFADATFEQDSTDLLTGMRELLRNREGMRTAPAKLNSTSA